MIISKLTSIHLLIFFSIFLTFSLAFADTDPNPNTGYHPEIIPPAPTVASLGKYGDVPVNMATGAPSVSVPLFEVKLRSGSLPVSLSYSSNGVRVDAIASWVGMEWSLNAGGIICRTIRGGPDETSREPIPCDLFEYSPGTVDFLINHWDKATDTEPDLFSYNFNGYSGKFIIGENGKVFTIPHNNLRIEVTTDIVTYRGIYSITVTTPDGVKYLFGEEYTDSTDKSRSCNFRSYAKGMRTAWHLKKITYPDGEYFSFFYSSKYLQYHSGISQTYVSRGFTNDCDQCPNQSNYVCEQFLRTHTQHLTKIISSGHDSVCFISSSREDSPENKLDSIKVYNSKGIRIKTVALKYSFIEGHGHSFNTLNLYQLYPELKYRMFLDTVNIWGSSYFTEPISYCLQYYDPSKLPKRLSFSQDHWGYYNASGNLDFVVPPDDLLNHPDFKYINCNREPKKDEARSGLLKAIKYPTKGTSEFIYEQNTYTTTEKIIPPLHHVGLDVESTVCDSIVSDTISFSVPFSQEAIFSAYCIFDSISCHKGFGEFSVYDLTTSTFLVPTTRIYPNQQKEYELNYEVDHIYRIRAKSSKKGTVTFAGTSYFLTQPYFAKVQKITGGMRIKQVINYSVFTSPDTTSYFYGTLQNINESSGVVGYNPMYCDGSTICKICGDGNYGKCHILNLFSSSVNNLFTVGGNNIMYQSVIKTPGNSMEKGGEISYFDISTDDPGCIVSYCIDPMNGATLNNNSWNNGQLLEKLEFKKNVSGIIPVKRTTYIYSTDSRKDTTIYGYVFRKNYNLYLLQDNYYYYCTAGDLKTRYYCQAQHSHQWYLLPGGTICIAPGAIPEDVTSHNCTIVGEQKVIYTALDNYSGIRYDVYLKWSHLDTLITTFYSTSGVDSITQITYHRYDNPKHTLPSIIRTFNSDLTTSELINYYPQDYENIFTQLMDKHIINKPIDQRVVKNGVLINGVLNHYDINGNLIAIDNAQNELGTSIGFSKTNPYSYGTRKTNISYDNENYLNSINNIDNFEINYLWSYYGQFPISEIKGSSFPEIQQVLQQGGYSYSTLRDTYDENYIESAMNYLRNNLSNGTVVSYTYNPQIGIISQTDANGFVTFYFYDQSGRLETIKDQNGKVLKHFKYHYASN